MYLCKVIFYFSGTGNTRHIARLVHETLGERLVDMADAALEDARFAVKEDERVGFVFPVHGWRTPILVRRFIDALHIEVTGKAPFCYVIMTAGDSIGMAMNRLLPHLERKDLVTQAVCSLVMPESYVGLPFMDVDTEEKERAKIAEADERLSVFLESVKNRDGAQLEEQYRNLTRGPLPSFFSGPVGAFFERYLIKDRPFKVDESLCVGCGKCAKVCPVQNIRCENGTTPKWLHNGKCLTCFACYHHCQKKAIAYGGRTKTKGQYYFGRRHSEEAKGE